MTQNIEERTLAATATMEGAAKSVDEIAHTDKIVETPVGQRKSIPMLSRELDEDNVRREGEHKTAQDNRESEFQVRFSQSQTTLPWQSGLNVADKLQRYSVGTVGQVDYKEFLPNPDQLPFTTGGTIDDDLAANLWLENGVPNKSYVASKSAKSVDVVTELTVFPNDIDASAEVGMQISTAYTGIRLNNRNYRLTNFVAGIIENIDLDNGYIVVDGVTSYLISTVRKLTIVNPLNGIFARNYYQSLLDSAGDVYFDKGEYIVGETLYFLQKSNVNFHPDAVLKPAVDGMLVCAASGDYAGLTNVHNCKIYNINIDLSGKKNCVGFRGVNFRNNSGLFNPNVEMGDGENNIGIDYYKLCWSTDLVQPRVYGGGPGSTRILLRNGANAVTVKEAKGNGGNPDIGIRVLNGLDGTFDNVNTFPTTACRIDGGLQQECGVGVRDSGLGTTVYGPYFEKCSEADVFYDGAIMPMHLDSHHASNNGTVCIKGRNAKGVDIQGVDLQGSRSGGLYDFDESNEYCYADKQRTATLNTVVGNDAGIKTRDNFKGSLPVGDIGPDANGLIKGMMGSSVSDKRAVSLCNGFDEVRVDSSGVIPLNSGQRILRMNISGDKPLTTSGTPKNGQSIKLAIRGSAITDAVITLDGVPIQTDNFPINSTKNAIIECVYLSELETWFIGPSYWT